MTTSSFNTAKIESVLNLILLAYQIAAPLAALIMANLHASGLTNEEMNEVLLRLAAGAAEAKARREAMGQPSDGSTTG